MPWRPHFQPRSGGKNSDKIVEATCAADGSTWPPTFRSACAPQGFVGILELAGRKFGVDH